MVFDIDLFSATPEQKFSDLKGTFSAINKEIFNVFTWAIRPTFISMLRMDVEERTS